jgi:hypothetical protein
VPEFIWAEGSRVSGGLSAQEAGEELTAIAGADETLTPQLVVKRASKKSSPLHDAFEWDDQEAARLHREELARLLIRSVKIVVKEAGKKDRITRAFVHIESEGEEDERRFYVTIQKAAKDEDMSDYVLERALRELNAWRRKYRNLDEVLPIIEALDEVL